MRTLCSASADPASAGTMPRARSSSVAARSASVGRQLFRLGLALRHNASAADQAPAAHVRRRAGDAPKKHLARHGGKKQATR